MEKIPNFQSVEAETGGENTPNFHEIAERRKELRKAIGELGIDLGVEKPTPKTAEGKIYAKHYQKPLEEAETQAFKFKVADFGSLSGAKEALRKQKNDYEEDVLSDRAHIDYEVILKETPEIGEVQKVIENIADLKDFRMRRMFEILSPQTSLPTKKRNEAVLKTVKEEIATDEQKLEQVEPQILRQTELIEYKENLAHVGHICITPSVEKDLEAIGDRMLTGKPMFLHGPTGTGKTSLARFAATHFTGKDPEMVFCNPQTKESNVWGKTGIKPAKGGAIETVEIYGPLSKAMIDGKTVIFDEFTALPKEQMVFIKGVFNAKVGDRINIVGNGIVEIKPGFQMIFTANLKSEKNPERQDLPPEIAREFEQNNLEVGYTPADESYDIMLSRLLNRDGSLDMSFYDLNTTLPKLCKVMSEIQQSYTNETDKEVARRAGAMDASGKVYSLKKFVMTQGSVESILSSWLVEKQTGKKERSFAEFLDERFKTALTFKEYSKEDRILVAKILASHGFLLTLDAKDLDLPEDIFKLNTIKSMRGEDAVLELRNESGDVKHLTLKEVAELDPFNKRAELLKNKAEALLSVEDGESDEFLKGLDKRVGKIFGKEKNKQVSEISAEYTHPDGRKETISLDFESKLQDFISFYQKTNLDLPADFEDTVRDIWDKNHDEIEQAIEQNGFDEILIIPGGIPLPDLSDKMKVGNQYYLSDNFKAGGAFAKAVSQNTDKTRILLVHKTQNLKDRPELKKTLNTKGQDVKLDQALTLEDYLVFQKKYFTETSKHLDEDGWTWLATKSGARLVSSGWASGGAECGCPWPRVSEWRSGCPLFPLFCLTKFSPVVESAHYRVNL
ncbi:MAG: AAA family ATPase [bacterium]